MRTVSFSISSRGSRSRWVAPSRRGVGEFVEELAAGALRQPLRGQGRAQQVAAAPRRAFPGPGVRGLWNSGQDARRRCARSATARCLAGERARAPNVMERVSLEVDAGTVSADSLELPQAGPIVEIESEEHARGRLLEVLTRTNWNISRTAALLGITRKTVRLAFNVTGFDRQRWSWSRPPSKRRRWLSHTVWQRRHRTVRSEPDWLLQR